MHHVIGHNHIGMRYYFVSKLKRIILKFEFVTKKGINALQQSLNTQIRSVSKWQS